MINSGATAQMRIMPEEIFGPVLLVIAYRELYSRHESPPPSGWAASVARSESGVRVAGWFMMVPIQGPVMALTVMPRKVEVFSPSG